MRWAILRDSSWFSPSDMARIIVVCTIIHNFIKKEGGADRFEREYQDVEQVDEEQYDPDEVETIAADDVHSCPPWTHFRDDLAKEMWEKWPYKPVVPTVPSV
ncbi:unnamed protein product [Linum trigynum]|uniref:Nuclease HARBI1 n=1 Tax=Linum trigynum TaxID=586398 RepID=A0AAV2ETU5_9ROSI